MDGVAVFELASFIGKQSNRQTAQPDDFLTGFAVRFVFPQQTAAGVVGKAQGLAVAALADALTQAIVLIANDLAADGGLDQAAAVIVAIGDLAIAGLVAEGVITQRRAGQRGQPVATAIKAIIGDDAIDLGLGPVAVGVVAVFPGLSDALGQLEPVPFVVVG